MRFAKRSRALFELGVKRGEALADVSHRLARKLDIGCRRVCLDLLGLVSAADDVHEVALRTQERNSELHARALILLADVGEPVDELDGARKAVGAPPQLAVAGVALRYDAVGGNGARENTALERRICVVGHAFLAAKRQHALFDVTGEHAVLALDDVQLAAMVEPILDDVRLGVGEAEGENFAFLLQVHERANGVLDRVRAMRARGVSEASITWKHALKNALPPIITVIAIQFAGCFAGAVLTENVFAWPGMGTMITSAIDNRDYSLIQATVLVVAIAFVVINLITDLLYMVINPKVAAEAKKGANNV